MMEGEILQRVRELERQVKVLLELHPDARAILSNATPPKAGMSLSMRPDPNPATIVIQNCGVLHTGGGVSSLFPK